MQGGILIIDYGSQYTQLIARRIREINVYCEIHPYNKVNPKLLKTLKPNGFVLSGGPNSILDKGSPKIPQCMKFISKPILGICYGLQLFENFLELVKRCHHETSKHLEIYYSIPLVKFSMNAISLI